MTNRKPWEGANVPDELRTPTSYPTVQWINQPFRLDPGQDNGGFFLAGKYGGITLPGSVEARYHNDEGTFTTSIEVTVLAIRSAWVEKQAGMEIRLSGYKDGARKRTQMLLLINDPENGIVGPVKFTTIGTANEQLPIAYGALSSTAKTQGAEPWMFWITLRAGETQTVGSHGVTMTPIEVSTPDADELPEAYVGNETVKRITAMADDIAAWATAWEKGSDISADVFEDDEDAQEIEAPNVPVTTQKYGRTTFGELMQRDMGYAVRVAEHITENPSGFNKSTVGAAQTVLDMGEDEEDTEEIPF
jgi:hypothetical protein